MRTTDELREGYLSFFESKGHARRPSGSLVPAASDPSTLLTIAGMQPLKPFFSGVEPPPHPRLTTVQKCFRTPDIDEVGLTARHLTFFQMLGNFSFGDYFKDGAIDLAWEFVTEHMGLDPELLWASVFAGDPELRLGEDDVAIAGWERVGIPGERIVRLPRSENFWQAGPTGPCGPCSELYLDRGVEHGCDRPDCAPGCECDRFLEFWNLVFMQFELHPDGTVTRLPKQNIDTGLGLERGAAILQDVHSVYETDGFRTIMDWIEAQTGTRSDESPLATKAHRVLADHGRGMTFLVADGVTPSNEGRGYILRRIIRRAVQHGSRIGLATPFLARLADVVIEQNGPFYPELGAHREEIGRILSAEEERFAETLARGQVLFDAAADQDAISGEQAFQLQATYGFPIELTVELARERGQAVDLDEFERQMAGHREVSRAGAGKGDQRAAEFAREAGFRTEFVGYEKLDVLTQLGSVEELGDGVFLGKLRESPFYADGGGQVSDSGFIENEATGARARLVQAFRFDTDQALVFEGEGFAAGDRVRAVVPWAVRHPTQANHTATHLLHAALRETLGDHVHQAGSSVRPDKLRFDFSHAQPLTDAEREAVERRVNEIVFENLPVRTFVTPIEEAKRLGAMALFGEKYGAEVRVVEVPGYSRELCGGAHVRSTAEIGPFAILSESSVGSGVRRIEAVTSGEAYAYLHAGLRKAEELRGELEQARRDAKKRRTDNGGPGDGALDVLLAAVKEAGGVNVVTAEVPGLDADALLALSDQVKAKRAPAAVVLGSREDGKVNLIANFDGSLPGRGLDAGKVIRDAAALVGGGGGGRPTMARAGGKDPERLPEALAAAEAAILAALA